MKKYVAHGILDFGSCSFDVPIEAESLTDACRVDLDFKDLPLYIQEKINNAEEVGVDLDRWFIDEIVEVEEFDQELFEDDSVPNNCFLSPFTKDELEILLYAASFSLQDADMFDELAVDTIGDEALLALREKLENWRVKQNSA